MNIRKLDPRKLKETIERRMAEDQAAGRVGDAAVCVTQEGQTLYTALFGKKSKGTGRRMPVFAGTTETKPPLFRLASMTKPVTAVAVLIQVERGLLDLDEPISRLLPGFAKMRIGRLDSEGRLIPVGLAQTPLTLRMLLNHTGGLGCMAVGDVQLGQMKAADRQDLSHMTNFLSRTMLSFEPATCQFYSVTAAFDVAARMVELTAQMPFDRFVKQNITDPCGMTDTTFTPSADQWIRMVVTHDRIDGRSANAVNQPSGVFEDFPTTLFSGSAGLASTLPDYVRFAEMLCQGGVTADGTRLLSADLVRAMGTATVPESVMPGHQKWGLGVRVITGDGCPLPPGCFGWSGAYGTHFWVDPLHRITAVYLKNSRYDGGSGAVSSFNFEKDVYKAMEDPE